MAEYRTYFPSNLFLLFPFVDNSSVICFRQLTVMDFLRTLDLVSQDSRNHAVAPVTCAPDACLGSIIDSLASKSVHRIYVVEGDEKEVVGVITLRDVISCFIYEPPYHFDTYFGCAVKELQSR